MTPAKTRQKLAEAYADRQCTLHRDRGFAPFRETLSWGDLKHAFLAGWAARGKADAGIAQDEKPWDVQDKIEALDE